MLNTALNRIHKSPARDRYTLVAMLLGQLMSAE